MEPLRFAMLLSMVTLVASEIMIHGPKEYCERETFEATCDEGNVIVMRRARYGRMRKGRCVKKDYGSLGCSTDVLRQVDDECSGRQKCSFLISRLHNSRPCPAELMSYLEASYECVPVVTCDPKMCQEGQALKLTSPSGFLASQVTSDSGCGSTHCPWILEPRAGQTYNMTLYNFHIPTPEEHQQKLCHRYATLKDQSTQVMKDVTVCGEEPRHKVYPLSDSARVEIRMFTAGLKTETTTPFLLRYEAIGCANMDPPRGGHVSRHGDTLSVRCNHTQGAWHLTCDGSNWVGEFGKCVDDTMQHLDRRDEEEWHLEEVLENAGSTPQGLLMVIGIGVALGVILGFVMLAVAVTCMKRRQRLQYHRQPVLVPHPSPGEKSDRTSFHTLTEPSPITGKMNSGQQHPAEDLYYRTYPVRQADLQQRVSQDAVAQAEGRSTRSLSQPGGGTVGDTAGFPSPPPPPYCHNHIPPDATSVRSSMHTYESPNFTAHAQRDPCTGIRRGSDVI